MGNWASENNIPLAIEASALSGENVDEVFERLAKMILTKIELGEIDPDDPHSGIQYGDTGLVGIDGRSEAVLREDGGTRKKTKQRSKGVGCC